MASSKKIKDMEANESPLASAPGHYWSLTPDEHSALKQFWQQLLQRFIDGGLKESPSKHSLSKQSSRENLKKQKIHHGKEKDPSTISAEPETIANNGASKSQNDLVTMSGNVAMVSVASTPLFLEFVSFCAFHEPDAICLRFLRARKWDIGKAVNMLWDTLEWRVEYGVKKIVLDGEEALPSWLLSSGVARLGKADNRRSPVIHITARSYNKTLSSLEDNKRHVVWLIEQVKDYFLHDKVETVAMVVDMEGFSLANSDMNFLSFLIKVLQNYYPESLGRALIVNAPFIFNGLWSMIKPLLDPVVAGKIAFVKQSDLPNYVPIQNLPTSLGGEDNYPYSYVAPPPLQSGKKEEIAEGSDMSIHFKEDCVKYLEACWTWSASENTGWSPERRAAIKTMIEHWHHAEANRPRTLYHRNGTIKEYFNSFQ